MSSAPPNPWADDDRFAQGQASATGQYPTTPLPEAGHYPHGYPPAAPPNRALPALVAVVTAVVVVAGAVVAVSVLGNKDPGRTAAAATSQTTSEAPTDQGGDDPDNVLVDELLQGSQGSGQQGSGGDASPRSSSSRSSSSSRPSSSSRSSSSSSSSSSSDPLDDDGAGPAITDDVQSEDSRKVATTLDNHGTAINTGAYQDAWALMTPAMHDRANNFDHWKSGVESSTWQTVRVREVTRDGNTGTAKISLQTTQAPDKGHGHDCLNWDLTYTFDASGSTWLIDKGAGDWSPC